MHDSSLLRRPLVAGLVAAATLSAGAAAAMGAGTSDRPTARAAQGAPRPPLECQGVAPPPRGGGQTAAFLALEGIDGASRDARHPRAIEVHGLRVGGERSSVAAPARPRVLVVSKSLDVASPRLLQALNDGRQIAAATLELAANGPGEQTYSFTDLTVVDYEHEATRGRNDERVCLSFRRVETSFRPRNADGSLGAAIVGRLGG